MKRVFVAIKIYPDETFLALFYDLKESFEREKIRWVDPENIHITMKFFGDTKEDQIVKINKVLKGLATGISPFKIIVQGVGTFGRKRNPGVLWFGINDNEQFILLSQEINRQLLTIGYQPDQKPFKPHLTIGRIKYLKNYTLFEDKLQGCKSEFIQDCIVNKFILYESILHSNGPEYVIIDEFRFEGGN